MNAKKCIRRQARENTHAPSANHRHHELPREGKHAALRQAQGNTLAPSAKPQNNTKSGPRAGDMGPSRNARKWRRAQFPIGSCFLVCLHKLTKSTLSDFFSYFFAKHNQIKHTLLPQSIMENPSNFKSQTADNL